VVDKLLRHRPAALKVAQHGARLGRRADPFFQVALLKARQIAHFSTKSPPAKISQPALFRACSLHTWVPRQDTRLSGPGPQNMADTAPERRRVPWPPKTLKQMSCHLCDKNWARAISFVDAIFHLFADSPSLSSISVPTRTMYYTSEQSMLPCPSVGTDRHERLNTGHGMPSGVVGTNDWNTRLLLQRARSGTPAQASLSTCSALPQPTLSERELPQRLLGLPQAPRHSKDTSTATTPDAKLAGTDDGRREEEARCCDRKKRSVSAPTALSKPAHRRMIERNLAYLTSVNPRICYLIRCPL